MDWSQILEFFSFLRTEELMRTLDELNFWELVNHPWFLIGAALLTLAAFVLRWNLLLITMLGVTTLSGISYFGLLDRFELEGLSVNNLLMMLGVGVVFLAIIMYLLFIKSDD